METTMFWTVEFRVIF